MEQAFEQAVSRAISQVKLVVPDAEEEGHTGCSEYQEAALRLSGWIFAKLFNFFFGEIKIILIEEGPQGEDLELYVTKKWLRVNQPGKFFPPGRITRLKDHLQACEAEGCQKAGIILESVDQIFEKGRLPGMALLASIPKSDRRKGNRLQYAWPYDRETLKAIYEIKPFVLLCTKRNFWLPAEDPATVH